jgi:hypothetical protein
MLYRLEALFRPHNEGKNPQADSRDRGTIAKPRNANELGNTGFAFLQSTMGRSEISAYAPWSSQDTFHKLRL